MMGDSATWEAFKKKREEKKINGNPSYVPPLNVDALANLRKGDKMGTTFGRAPAQLICVETFEEPTLFRRFLVMAYGCEVAEVVAEKLQNGKWVLEEL